MTSEWHTEIWRQSAAAWIDEGLAASGLTRTGPIEQPRIRPWATVLTAPTDKGPVWMKACAPGPDAEVGLYDLLNRVVPGTVLTPLASDPGRGWLLLPDGGEPLDRDFDGDADTVLAAMADAMPRYATLQRALAPHADALVALGLPDMRPAVMPARFPEAIAVARPWVERHGNAGEREQFARISSLEGEFGERCARLVASPIPASVDHNDLHPANVLPGPAGAPDRVRFYDWGDSVVAHPFASLLVVFRVTALGYEVPADDRRSLRVRDAYLEAFTDLAPRDELIATLEDACRVAVVARALVWARAAGASPAPAPDADVPSDPFETLTMLTGPAPYGIELD